MEHVSNRFVISDTIAAEGTPTDVFEVINSSNDKRVYGQKVVISGTAATAITTPVVAIRRTADTSGTSAAVSVYQTNSSNSVSMGVTAKKYTADPTIAGTAQEVARQELQLGLSSTVTASSPVVFEFCELGIAIAPGESLAINLAGATISTGVIMVSVQGFVDNRGI